jgi:hypothetical protein
VGNKNNNVFYQRVYQPTAWVQKAWHNEVILRVFNFIAIKQGTYVRYARI